MGLFSGWEGYSHNGTLRIKLRQPILMHSAANAITRYISLKETKVIDR